MNKQYDRTTHRDYENLKILRMSNDEFYDLVLLANNENFEAYLRLYNRMETEDTDEVIQILKMDVITELLKNKYNIKKVGNYGITLEGVIL